MDDNNEEILGYSTRHALIKLRNDISGVIEEYKKKIPTGYVFLIRILNYN